MYLHLPVCDNLFMIFPIGSSNNSDIAASICRDTRFNKAQQEILHQLSECLAGIFEQPPILPPQVIKHACDKVTPEPM